MLALSARAATTVTDWNLPAVTTMATTSRLLGVLGAGATDSVAIAAMDLRTTGMGIPANPNIPGAHFMVNGDNEGAWFTPSTYIWLYDDFFSGTVNTVPPLGWVNASTGTSATFALSSMLDAAHMGIWRVDTGSTTNGKGIAHLGSTSWVFGNGRMIAEWLMDIDTLSTDAEKYTLRIGFNDAITGGAATDGAYFRYQHDLNSGNWDCLTVNNTATTTTSTSVAATASTTGTAWHKFRIDVDAAGANAYFYIDGTSVATNSANIPVTVARATGPAMVIDKIGGTVGTTSRKAYFDYFWLLWQATTPR